MLFPWPSTLNVDIGGWLRREVSKQSTFLPVGRSTELDIISVF
jgi:hypothetical protein